MSIKQFVRQFSHYLPLLGMLAAGLVGILIFSSDRKFQEAMIIASSAGYVTWGIMHHIAHKDLTLSILVEYFAVALLGLVIVFSILFRT